MRVKKIPQRNDAELTYQFDGGKITAMLNGQSDTFDFTDMPEGKAVDFDTTLDPCPIKSAERDANGELWVEVMAYYGAPPTQSEEETDANFQARLDEYERIKFPEWETV